MELSSWLSSVPLCSTPVSYEHGSTAYLHSSGHITDALVGLRWLRSLERLQFNVAALKYKALRRSAPT